LEDDVEVEDADEDDGDDEGGDAPGAKVFSKEFIEEALWADAAPAQPTSNSAAAVAIWTEKRLRRWPAFFRCIIACGP
jgi:hypothetical protein